MGRNEFVSSLAKTAFSLFKFGCVTHCVTEYVFNLSICSGPSMEPTLNSNDIIVGERISPRLHRYNYGDIVVFRSLENSKEFVCKRITGLPGDKIHFRDKRFIPAGHVWLEGDNRDNSWDSRDYGPVPQGLIVGRVVCKIFPPKDITMLTVKSR